MKKITKLVLTAMVVVLNLGESWGQTYNGRTWYSLYEAGEFSLSTVAKKEFGVFAPTDGSVSFDWKYSGTFLKNHTTTINESSNDGSNYTKKGEVSGTSQTKYASTPSSIALSTNINKVKFDRAIGNTNTVTYKNVKIPLAKHILLDDNTTYGTTSMNHTFAETEIQSVSTDVYTVNLRSFLTNGNITITSSNSAFRVGTSDNTGSKTFTVGANACASKNGASGKTCALGVLGDIHQYSFNIYFYPTLAQDYSGTITITDGTNTATINVSGRGKKLTPSITWTPDAIVFNVDETLSASSNDGLVVTLSGDRNYVRCDGNTATMIAASASLVTITATVAGNATYEEKSFTKDITITELTKQTITWTQDFGGLSLGGSRILLDATASSGLPCTYETSDASVVSLSQEGGSWYLNIIGEGEAFITAKQAGNATYAAAPDVEKGVLVYDPSKPCPTGGTLLSSETDVNGQEYTVACPKSLTFDVKKKTLLGIPYAGNLIVSQYINGHWETIYNDDNIATSYQSFNINLSNQATAVKIDKGPVAGYTIKNIRYTRDTHTTADKSRLDFDTYINTSAPTQTITINNANTRVVLSHNNARFTVSESMVGGCGVAGNYTITVGFNAGASTGEENDVLYLKDHTGRDLGSIILHANITKLKLNDVITWKYENNKHFWADADIASDFASANTRVSYSVDQPEYVSISNDPLPQKLHTLKAWAGQPINITATTAGDEDYNSVVESRVIYIDSCYQALDWTQDFLRYTATEAGVIDETVGLTAVAKDSLGLATGLTVRYNVSGDPIAEITGTDGNYSLHIFGSGTAMLTAYTEASDKYMTAVERQEIRVRKEGDACESFALIDNTNRTISSMGNNTYVLSGPGERIRFQAKKLTGITIDSNGTCKIQGYNPSTGNWTNIYDVPALSTEWTTYECDINEVYTKIKWTSSFEGGSKNVRNVTVSQKSYLRTSDDEITETAYVNTDFARDFTISYSDKPALHYSVGGGMTLTPDREVENDCGDWGEYTFTLGGRWTTPQVVNETIRITTSAGDELEIPIRINVLVGDKFIYETTGNWTTDDHWNTDRQPSYSNEVEIQKPVVISTQVEVYSIELTGDGTITIAPNGGLTVGAGGITDGSGNAITDASKIRIRSALDGQGYLRVSPETSIAMPHATVEYASRGNLDAGVDDAAVWQYMGVPFATSMGGGQMWLYLWDEQEGWIEKTSTETLVPFRGYAITQYGQPTYEYEGQLLQADQVITLTKTDAGMQGDNLFANSYMSPIDTKTFTDEDFVGNVEKTFYIFNSGSYNDFEAAGEKTGARNSTPGQYNAIPAGSARYINDAVDQTLIAPMQGIYMMTNEDGAQVKLNYEKHVWAAASATQMNRPLRVRGNVNVNANVNDNVNDNDNHNVLSHRVRIEIEGEKSGKDHVYVFEKEGFKKEYENGYDAWKIMGEGEELVNIYISHAEGKMAVDATPEATGSTIGIHAGADEWYTLRISSVIGDSLILRDNETLQEIQIEDGAEYGFVALKGSKNEQRFTIVSAREKAVEVTTGNVDVNDNANANDIRIYTISGQEVSSMSAGHGVYIVCHGNKVIKVMR